jgi:hypothetical protein
MTTAKNATIPNSDSRMKCGMASSSRKKVVRRLRCSTKSASNVTG